MGWRGPFKRSFRKVRGGSRGGCPFLLPEPHYESQRAAPPRALAAEAMTAGSWSPQRPRRSLTPTGRGSCRLLGNPRNRHGREPRRCPAALPKGGGRGAAPGVLVVVLFSQPSSLRWTLLVKVAFIWETCWGIRGHYLKALRWSH